MTAGKEIRRHAGKEDVCLEVGSVHARAGFKSCGFHSFLKITIV